MDYLQKFQQVFSIDRQIPVDTYSPLALAYLGDAVFELMIRHYHVSQANRQSADYHQATKDYVNAGAQAILYNKIKERLTDEEQAVFRRGRNARTKNKPKNVSRQVYQTATGIETLMGYLFLKGEYRRLMVLTAEGVIGDERTVETSC